jgi:hypothetical protein
MKQKGKKKPTKACPSIIRVKLFGKCKSVEGPTIKSEKPVMKQPTIIVNLLSMLVGTN